MEDGLSGIDNRVGGRETTKTSMNHFGGKQSFSESIAKFAFPTLRPTERRWQTRGKRADNCTEKVIKCFSSERKLLKFQQFAFAGFTFPPQYCLKPRPPQYDSRKLPTNMHKHNGSCSIKISILILETKASYAWHFSAETNVGVECAKRRQIK